jgi:hypothetical protein
MGRTGRSAERSGKRSNDVSVLASAATPYFPGGTSRSGEPALPHLSISGSVRLAGLNDIFVREVSHV